MSGDEESTLAEARRHHRAQVNSVLRRPGIFGRDEMVERLVLEAMAAVDGSLARWWAECDGLRNRRAFTATGVHGAYGAVLPAEAVRDAVTSMYAEIAHRCGWLDLDRTLSTADHRRMAEDIGGWVTRDRTLSELVDTFGPPSLWIGSTSSLHPKTLAYATDSRDDALICIHLSNAGAESVVLAARHLPGEFPDSFSFTPEGRRRRPTNDDFGPTVWIFHGKHARYASAVFETADDGLAWAAEHRVTGILTEYQYGGTYDAAVRQGRFRPSKPHHGTAEHVAGFSPGLTHIHLTEGAQG